MNNVSELLTSSDYKNRELGLELAVSLDYTSNHITNIIINSFYEKCKYLKQGETIELFYPSNRTRHLIYFCKIRFIDPQNYIKAVLNNGFMTIWSYRSLYNRIRKDIRGCKKSIKCQNKE